VAEPKDVEGATRQFSKALRLAAACEARPLAAFTQTMLSVIHDLRGDTATARQFAAAADATYAELEIRPPSLGALR
jgi:hypothetical protein